MFYVYLLKSLKDKSTYIGYTEDLKTRFIQHNKGKVRSTKPKKPLILAYYESYLNKTDARKREIELKNHGQKKELLFKQIENSLE